MEGMPRPRPPHLHREVTRHGRVVWYVRADKKGPRIRIKADYGTDEFKATYDAAIRGEAPPTKADYAAATLGWLVARYRESTAWTALALSTRRMRENILKHVLAKAAHEPFTRVDRKAIVAGRDRRKDTPNAARHFVQTLHGLFDWAVEAQHAAVDPTLGVKVKRPKTEGFKIWPADWHDKFKARWPLGTRPRVVYAVAYCTGLRRGDLVVVGRPHVKGNRGKLRTEKGKILAYFPFDSEVQEAIATGPVGELTFIASESGQPITKETLGNYMRDWCDAAGVAGSLHGLRKAKATYVAEHGATEAELDSMFGWKRGSGTSAIYTKTADAERLAGNAIDKLERAANAHSRTLTSGAGGVVKKDERSNG